MTKTFCYFAFAALLAQSACGGRIEQADETFANEDSALTVSDGSRSLTVSKGAAQPGEVLAFSGSGFSPNQAIVIKLDGTTLPVTEQTDAAGSFSDLSAAIPQDSRVGSHHFYVATGDLFLGLDLRVRTNWLQFQNGANHRGLAQSDGGVLTSDYHGGYPRWSQPTGARIVGSPIVYNAYLYIGNEAGDLLALRWATAQGSVAWRRNLGSPVYSTPAAGNGRVIVGSESGVVHALASQTGEPIWTFVTGAAVTAPIAMTSDTVYVASRDHHVYALTPETGALKWSADVGSEVVGSPSVYDGRVYIGTLGGNFYALDSGTGAERWHRSIGAQIRSSAAVVSSVAYFGADDGRLYALDLNSNGAVKWFVQTEGLVRSTPAVGPVLTYFGSYDGAVHAVRTATGQAVWARDLLGPVRASPTLTNDLVVLGVDSSSLYDTGILNLMNAETGAFIPAALNNDGPTQSSPAIASGSVFFGDDVGVVRAYP